MSPLELNKKIARNFLSKVAAIDVEGIKGLFTQDVEYHIPNTGCTSGTLNLKQFLKTLAGLGKACPNGLRLEVRDLTAEEDRVSCRVDGFAAMVDGAPYCNRYHFLLKIRGGKIYEVYEFYDSLLVENLFAPLLNANSGAL